MRMWPPYRTVGASLLWAVVVGFICQLTVPMVLASAGLERAALYSIWPGLLPIVWTTRGWFAGITPLGYVMMISINTVIYALPFFVMWRIIAKRYTNQLS
jgi:hypothetical protein